MNNHFYKLGNFRIVITTIFFFMLSSINAQNLFINEFMASNVISTPEIVDYDDYSDWIEIYNDSSASINLSGYYITDNLNNPTKWQIPVGTTIPAKGFLVFWADGYDDSPGGGIKYYHLNFSLSKDGEEIGLFSPEQILIDSITYGVQISDVSFGRQPDGANNWKYFGESTPSNSNLTFGTSNTEISSMPEIALPSGLYTGEQLVSINETADIDFYYTLDGSMPSTSSQKYLTPIVLNNTTTLRVRAFESDKLPSKIITRAYFINVDQNLPILSLTVFPETLFGDEFGIYSKEIRSREVPVNAQLFEIDGEKAFDVDAGIRITGEASALYPQKGFTIGLDDRYGDEFIDYKIFPKRNYTNYTSLYLRNSGAPDNGHTMFRDALQHNLVINDIDVDGQAYRPVTTYINGEYWGIYNLREKIDNNYFALNHDVDPENLDIIDKYVDIIDFNILSEFLENNDLALAENYEYAKSKIDINEFINYTISQIFYANCDWLNNNTIWWREGNESSKWRWIFQDLDNGFGMESWYCTSNYSDNFIEVATSDPNSVHYKDEYTTVVLRNLIKNSEFKNEFIQRFALILNTLFDEERVLNYIDSLQSQISAEMVHHIARWNGYESTNRIPILKDYESWLSNVELMREFARNRPSYQRQHILDYFEISGTKNLEFHFSDPNAGIISVVGIRIKDGHMGEYFIDVPMKIEAFPVIGYRFVKWIGVQDSLSQSTFYTPSNTDSTVQITVVFEEDNTNILPSIISENRALDISGSPYLAKGDINVNSGVTLSVEPGVEILMPNDAHLIVNGSLQMNGTEEAPIIIKPNESSGFNSWGIIYLNNSSGESTLNHVQLIGATNGDIQPNQMGAISSY